MCGHCISPSPCNRGPQTRLPPLLNPQTERRLFRNGLHQSPVTATGLSLFLKRPKDSVCVKFLRSRCFSADLWCLAALSRAVSRRVDWRRLKQSSCSQSSASKHNTTQHTHTHTTTSWDTEREREKNHPDTLREKKTSWYTVQNVCHFEVKRCTKTARETNKICLRTVCFHIAYTETRSRYNKYKRDNKLFNLQ